MTKSQVEQLVEIHSGMTELQKSRKSHTAKFKKYVELLYKSFEVKYGEDLRNYGIADQTFGGRETGRLSVTIELAKTCSPQIDIDYHPSRQGGEIVYGRIIANTKRAIVKVAGIIPVIDRMATNLDLTVGLDSFHHNRIQVGGNYDGKKLPQIIRLINTIDDMLDFYIPETP